MIQLAKNSSSGIDFRVADAENLPFADGSFDAVVCNFGLGHFPYPEASVAECVRVLKPAARIALSWWDDPSKQRIQGLFREAVAEIGATPSPDVPKGHAVYRFADTKEFRNLLEGADLIDVRDTRRRNPLEGRSWRLCTDRVGDCRPRRSNKGRHSRRVGTASGAL